MKVGNQVILPWPSSLGTPYMYVSKHSFQLSSYKGQNNELAAVTRPVTCPLSNPASMAIWTQQTQHNHCCQGYYQVCNPCTGKKLGWALTSAQTQIQTKYRWPWGLQSSHSTPVSLKYHALTFTLYPYNVLLSRLRTSSPESSVLWLHGCL